MSAMNFSVVAMKDSVFGKMPVTMLRFDTPFHDLKVGGKPVTHMRTAVYLKEEMPMMRSLVADKVANLLARHYEHQLGNPKNHGIIPLEAERRFQRRLKNEFGDNFLMVQNMGYVH